MKSEGDSVLAGRTGDGTLLTLCHLVLRAPLVKNEGDSVLVCGVGVNTLMPCFQGATVKNEGDSVLVGRVDVV